MIATRFCSSCSRKLGSDEPYVVHPDHPDDVRCLSCGDAGLLCTECGEQLVSDDASVHPGCVEVTCAECDEVIKSDNDDESDDDESDGELRGIHRGCAPSSTPTKEETPDDRPTPERGAAV